MNHFPTVGCPLPSPPVPESSSSIGITPIEPALTVAPPNAAITSTESL